MISFYFFKPAATEANDDSVDELIELSGCNIKTFWRFPNVTECPVHKCSNYQFGSRMEAKRHYIATHAKDAILCELCKPNKPIASPNPICYKIHYQRMHGNPKLPFNLSKRPIASVEPQEIQTQHSTSRVAQV